jgi:protein associated with RNAse G/E
VRRDVVANRIWSAQAARVLTDDGSELAIGYWPGAEALVPTTFIRWLQTRAAADRAACLKAFTDRTWSLGRRRWDTTNVVHLMTAGRWFSINAFFDARTGDHAFWYINFERPFVRTPEGVDTLDLLLDLVVLPDLSWQWKDEDEYDHARRMGVITTADVAAVDQARDEVVALVKDGGPPFTSDWPMWRPSTNWPTPTLSEQHDE